MRHLDLCSGIGGFALAASWVWPHHEVAAFVEIDEYCQQVLRKHWPDAPIHDDLRTYDARPLRESIDLITGGYPCQPFSVAGKREGAADDRHLWPEVRRVVEECRPRWCLFENVAGHVTMGLDRVLADLEGLGYTCEAAVIPACAVDARHRRDRLWIVAHTSSTRKQTRRANTVGNDDRPRSNPQLAASCGQSQGFLQHTNGKRRQERHAPAVTEGPQQHPRRLAESGCHWSLEPGVGELADGLPRWMDEPAGVPRVAKDIPGRTNRLRALGNAIVPQVAAEIMRAIKHADTAKTPTPCRTADEVGVLLT